MLLSLQLISHLFLVHAQKSRPVEYSLETILGGQIGDGMKATNVGMYRPYGLAVDKKNGNIYYAESGNHQVRYLDSNSGISHYFAGAPNYQAGVGSDSLAFANDSLTNPYGVAINSKGEVFITGLMNRVKKVFFNSTINEFNMITIAGGGSLTTSGVPALSARLSYPVCIAVSPKDEIFICDNNNIRKIVNDTFYNVVGNGQLGNSPDGTPAVTASIKTAYGIAFHPVTGKFILHTDSISNI